MGAYGPNSYPLDLYKDGEYFVGNGFQLDSCTIRFKRSNELYLKINICSNKIAEIRPNKKLLEFSEIDSAYIFSKELKQTKNLSEQQIKTIVQDWNKSKVSDYRDKHKDSIFYPDYQYKITLFSGNKKREYLTANYLISDNTKWTYHMTDEKDMNYFFRIWKE